jgi:phosphonate transport system substrate-binding protein
VALAVGLAGCTAEPAATTVDLQDRATEEELQPPPRRADATVFRFGFDHRASPEEDVRQYLPFLGYLSRATGYRFEIHFTPAGANLVDELGTGKVHFAAIGAGSYVRARERYGAVPLARGLNSRGLAEYRSVLVVRPDSPIRRVADLRGRSFAFGDFNSTQGHLIPRIVLLEHGVDVNDLARHEYTGSHRNCAEAVIAGRFDAGGMQDTLGEELVGQGLLRILYTSRPYPSSAIAASTAVPALALARVKAALLAFAPKGRDAAGLYHWDKTEMPNGFGDARDEDYAQLRQSARTFGLLGSPAPERAP